MTHWKPFLNNTVKRSHYGTRRRPRVVVSGIQSLEDRCLLAADLDDQPEEATLVTTPATINGVIDSRSDVDAYRIDLEAGVRVTLSVSETGGTSLVPQIRVWGPLSFGSRSLTELGVPSIGLREFTAIQTGAHYVTVANRGMTFVFTTGFDGTPPFNATTGNYSLSIGTSNDPPSIVPDSLESNNSFEEASHIANGTGDDAVFPDLSIHNSGDNDFFKFFPRGNGTLNVSASVLQGSGSVDLLIYDKNKNLIGSSTAIGGDEFVSVKVDARQTPYFIRVQPVGQTVIEQYRLTIDGPTPLPDRFESNESASQAADLGVVTTNGLLVEGLTLHSITDRDFFKFTPERGGRLTLSPGGDHAGDFSFTLYDENLIALNRAPLFAPTDEVTAGKQYYASLASTGAVLESYKIGFQLIEGPSVSISNVSVVEGDAGTKNAVFTVSLSATPQNSLPTPLSIAYATESGSAIAGLDFTANSGRLTFSNNEREKTILVPIIGDKTFEPDEFFSLVLSDARGANIDGGVIRGRGTIQNDDQEVLVDLAYTASGSTVLSATVASNGHLQVKLGSVTQADVDPITVRSLKLTGGSGNDSINLSGLSPSLYTRLVGVTLNGGAGNDVIQGSDWNETISGGTGNDVLGGGPGTDLLLESGDVNFTLTDTSLAGLGADILSEIETVSLTGGNKNNTFNASGFTQGSVTLVGGGGNDLLQGSDAADLLSGGAGNDILQGNSGNDTLTGDAGNDSFDGGADNDRIVEIGNVNLTLSAAGLLGLGTDTFVEDSIEEASLTGGAGNNALAVNGFTGAVTLSGGAGSDTLTGGLGDDSLDGGAGTDMLLVSRLVDSVLTKVALTGSGNDQLSLIELAKLTVAADAPSGTIDASGFSGSVTLTGGNGDDLLTGGIANDSIVGGGGNDDLHGGAGLDTLDGGAGRDCLHGDAENDKLVGGVGNDTIHGGIGNDSIDGGADDDVLLGDEGNDTLLGGTGDRANDPIGSRGDDILIGGDGNDSLSGQDGNDTILGGLGVDKLSGGNGNDTLSGEDGKDTLAGDAGNDTLFGGAEFDSFTAPAAGEKNEDGVFSDLAFFSYLNELLAACP